MYSKTLHDFRIIKKFFFWKKEVSFFSAEIYVSKDGIKGSYQDSIILQRSCGPMPITQKNCSHINVREENCFHPNNFKSQKTKKAPGFMEFKKLFFLKKIMNFQPNLTKIKNLLKIINMNLQLKISQYSP